MNARTFLVRGLLAGLIAGIAAFLMAFAVGEPPIDKAIGLEESASAAEAPSEAASHTHADGEEVAPHSHGEEAETGFSRSTQKAWGLATATVVVGIALGGIVSLIAAGVAGRMGRLSVVGSTALVAALGFLAYALVPFLKYPAAPPAVGSGDTIGQRTAYYFVFALISVVAMVAVVALARRTAAAKGSFPAVVIAGAVYLVVVVVAAVAMPAVNELGDFPADVLWDFRVSSILTLATLGGVLGVTLAWLLGRVESGQRATA